MLDNLGNEVHGCIYKATNIQNNKCYIGKSKRFKDRKKAHLKKAIKGSHNYFHNALASYGKENFKWEILGFCNSKEELNEAEIACIEFFQSINPLYGYNKTKGGDGGDTFTFHPKKEEVRRNRSKSLKNLKRTEETKENIRKATLNHIVTEETRIKISKKLLGNIPYNKGKNNIELFGIEKAEEIKNKRINKIIGSKWMNNGKISKCIKPKEVNFYISLGWEFGRLLKNKNNKN